MAKGAVIPIVINKKTFMDKDQEPEESVEPEVEKSEPIAESEPSPEVEESPEENLPHLEDKTKKPAHHQLWQKYLTHKRWTIPASVVLVMGLVVLIPWTRYHTAGLVLKKDAIIVIKDSVSNTPVSGATVSDGSSSSETDGNGKAILRSLSVGHHTLTVSKKYYKDGKTDLLVPVLKAKNTPNLSIVATGRQVKIKVTDFVNGGGLSNVDIEVAGTDAKTDKNGEALVVVPAGVATQTTNLSFNGYNSLKTTIKVSDNSVAQNNLKLVASGKVYFLSKLSGTIDIVKTNLDGSGRQTVLPGTGKEDDTDTILLASRDWGYLTLLSTRDGDKAKLFVMNTNDDKLLTMDEGDATFTPVGWYNHYFIYTVGRNGYNAWQPNAFSIKSYNADTGQLATLANTNASGSSNYDAQYEAIWNTIIMGNDVVYSRTWYKYPGYTQVSGQQNVLSAIHPDGTNSRQLKSVDSSTSYISNLRLNKPSELDFSVYDSGSSNSTYYVLDKQGNVNQSSDLTDKSFYNEATTYLASPSGQQTFWQEERDGKNTLFIGDQDGGNPKQIASLSDYDTYGWYTDNYLLVSKNGSELYIMSKNGLSDELKALKISDYHKPDRSFYGYGGGYGGI